MTGGACPGSGARRCRERGDIGTGPEARADNASESAGALIGGGRRRLASGVEYPDPGACIDAAAEDASFDPKFEIMVT